LIDLLIDLLIDILIDLFIRYRRYENSVSMLAMKITCMQQLMCRLSVLCIRNCYYMLI